MWAGRMGHIMRGIQVARSCVVGDQIIATKWMVVNARNRRTTRPITAAALAVAVGLVLLPACSANDTSSGTSSPSAAASAPIKVVGFNETYRTDDGIVVRITKIDEGKLGPFPNTDSPDAKEGDPGEDGGDNEKG